MPGLDDYGALLRSAQASVPDYAEQQAQQQLMGIRKQQMQLQTQELMAKLEQRKQFGSDVQSVLADPNAGNVSNLILKHPEYAEQIKSGWDLRDKAVRQTDLTQLGEIYSAGQAGKWDVAAKAARTRFDADKAAGQADPSEEQIVNALESGNPADRNAALGMIGVHLAAATGAEHFGSVYGTLKGGYTLEAGATRFDDSGNEIARSPYMKGADGTVFERDSVAPGGASTAAAPAPDGSPPATTDHHAGFDNAVETVLSNEGGYAAADMNGAPVNFGINGKANPGVDIKNLTRDQAKQIYHDKYWVPSGAENLPANLQTPYFDVYIRNPKVAKAALTRSGGDPAKFMDITDSYFSRLGQKPDGQKYAKAWANRDIHNRAIATGGAPSSDAVPEVPTATAAAAPPGYHVLIPGKGKDAPSGYRWSADGSKLEAIAGGPADQQAEGLDQSTVSYYAQQILAGGQMPTLGMGKSAAAARMQIMSEVSRQARSLGLNGKDLATQQAHFANAKKALGTLETQAATVGQNEQTAILNGQQFIEQSQALSLKTRFPIVNAATMAYLRHTGDPTVIAMDNAYNTFVNEYAKVVSGSPSGAGVLSDSARHEAMSTLKGNYSLQQKQAAFAQMQKDMANRMTAIRSGIAHGYQDMSKVPSSTAELTVPSSAPLPKGAKVVGTYQGKRVIEVNGRRMVEQ